MSRAGVAADVAERVLGHKIPGVRGVYDRHQYISEKRDALERLAVLIPRRSDFLMHRLRSTCTKSPLAVAWLVRLSLARQK